MNGELQLKIEADDVTATTFFRELQNHVFGERFLSHRVDCVTIVTQHHFYRLKIGKWELSISDVIAFNSNLNHFDFLILHYIFLSPPSLQMHQLLLMNRGTVPQCTRRELTSASWGNFYKDNISTPPRPSAVSLSLSPPTSGSTVHGYGKILRKVPWRKFAGHSQLFLCMAQNL